MVVDTREKLNEGSHAAETFNETSAGALQISSLFHGATFDCAWSLFHLGAFRRGN